MSEYHGHPEIQNEIDRIEAQRRREAFLQEQKDQKRSDFQLICILSFTPAVIAIWCLVRILELLFSN